MNGILSWWDGVELWLTGRGFLLQVILVIPAVLGLAFGLALVGDAILGEGIRVLHRIRRRKADRT